MDCPNKKKNKGNRILIVTWSDFEKKEKSDCDDESKNFTTFMTSAAEVTKTSSKAQETKNQMNQIVQWDLSRKNQMMKTKVNCSEHMINCTSSHTNLLM